MRSTILRTGFAAFVGATALLIASAASAAMVNLKAEMKAANEVPPVAGNGSGTLTATYDTTSKKLTWKGTYKGLSGPATAAHFHGPAENGKNAGVVIPIGNDIKDSFDGSATLTDAQAADMLAGKWYVNIHTATNKAGEVRGQLSK